MATVNPSQSPFQKQNNQNQTNDMNTPLKHQEIGFAFLNGIAEECIAIAVEKQWHPDESPNNRPQDGRVCDCEDAPCCGHYES